jgi:hypothetical protein
MNLCARCSAFLSFLLFCSSCHKQNLGPCTGNCEVVQFSGVAVDPGAQKPLSGLTVTVYMPRTQSCLYCGSYQVASGKTKGDGTFDLTVSVDTTKVINQSCTIDVAGPASYITYAVPAGPGIASDPYSDISESVLALDSTGAAPYEEYDFYQSVLMTVQLHRTSAILPSEPFLGLSFAMGVGASLSSSVWGLNETSTNADTALTLYTGAGVFTKINAIQFITDSTKENQTDSIRCVAGGNNTIVISY